MNRLEQLEIERSCGHTGNDLGKAKEMLGVTKSGVEI